MEKIEECNLIQERYALSKGRICSILGETTTAEPYRAYFQHMAGFLLFLDEVYTNWSRKSVWERSLEELEAENKKMYEDILPERYDTSYANPAYAVHVLGMELGQFLSVLYAELRGGIVYAVEGKLQELVILNELFLEIYGHFEEEEEPKRRKLEETLYWYASDYSDVILADRIRAQIDPSETFAIDIIRNSDLSDPRYLYQFGEYITENEKQLAGYVSQLPEETIQKMADAYTNGYRDGFLWSRIDLSRKRTVDIRYTIGFERVIKKAFENFEQMGLQPVLFRAAVSIMTKRKNNKAGYYGAIANKQYEFDHKDDIGLILDKRYLDRKMEVTRTVYEKYKDLARGMGGPAVMETFGEEPFAPVPKSEAVQLQEKQQKLQLTYDGKMSRLTNEYIPGSERSFTIIAYPAPAIGPDFDEIFDEIIRINTLDSQLYAQIQQRIIDALDEGEYVHILGKDGNRTDLNVHLTQLHDPSKETKFENCVADMNIPVGEVFTTPVLEGTNGTLHVSKVYLHGLQYRDLELTFADGKIADYRCGNFETEEEGRKYLFENLLFRHETLPLGEFAIGTNTTAYMMAKKYDIEDKLPILIAEKMGPHFAVGDTCYSWSEDNHVYNPNGKEIVAKDNSVSILRKTKPEEAYVNCHTDITIPYEELEKISICKPDGGEVVILQDGRFVLPGTELLNEPFSEE